MTINSSIDFKDISVVVQGPVYGASNDPESERWTAQTLSSIRRFLPGATIILSTWKGSDLAGLDFDEIVLCEDPGGMALKHNGETWMNNVNRQIVSSLEGLKKITTRYALKTRTDVIFRSNNFLKYWNAFPKRSYEMEVFEERIIGITLSSRSVRKGLLKYPFQPCDWFHFGLAHDVLKLWNIPLAQLDGYGNYFENRPHPTRHVFCFSAQFTPEQYIWISCLKQYHPVQCEHYADLSGNNIKDSELAMVNNFIIIQNEDVEIFSPKYPRPSSYNIQISQLTHLEWLLLYKKYCDPTFKIESKGKKLTKARIKSFLGTIDYLLSTKSHNFVFRKTRGLLRRGFKNI